MDGVHDMGGMHGFGKVPTEDNGKPFAQPWQARVFATNLAMSVHTGNVDRFRFQLESIPPEDYLVSSYYERWLAAMMANAREQGFLDNDQLQTILAGTIPDVKPADTEAAPPGVVAMMLDHCADGGRDYSGTGRFAVGDKVRAVNRHTPGHTRLPRYVRGHQGAILKDNGNQLLPDIHAKTGEVVLQRLYTVTFDAVDLWGAEANPRDSVCLDLWESYLDAI